MGQVQGVAKLLVSYINGWVQETDNLIEGARTPILLSMLQRLRSWLLAARGESQGSTNLSTSTVYQWRESTASGYWVCISLKTVLCQYLNAIIRKGHQCLQSLRRLKRFGMSRNTNFYKCTIESILTLHHGLVWQYKCPGTKETTESNKHCLVHRRYWHVHLRRDRLEVLPQKGQPISKTHSTWAMLSFHYYCQVESTEA